MSTLKNEVIQGAKDAWSMFLAPITGFFGTSKNVIGSPAAGGASLTKEFQHGVKQGWAVYWSPLIALASIVRMVSKGKP